MITGTPTWAFCDLKLIKELSPHFRAIAVSHIGCDPTEKPEKNGYDYDFISDVEFKKRIQVNKFIEFEKVHGYYYGTPKANIYDVIVSNGYLLLEVDVKGAQQIKKAYPEQAVTVFITLPDVKDFLKRLKKRGSESGDRIKKRMERIEMELEFKNDVDCCIINDDFDRALNELIKKIGIEN